MPNPKRKHTPHRRDSRRSANSKIFALNSSSCPNCKAPKMPHRVCPVCGFYDGEMIVAKKEKKAKTQEAAQESK